MTESSFATPGPGGDPGQDVRSSPRLRDASALKRLVKRALGSVGWYLARYKPETCFEAQRAALLRSGGVDLVLDVGGNTGQFGTALRDSGYRGRIVSFEPLAAPYRALQLRAAADPCWSVAPRMALGDECGRVTMNVSDNSVSSSVLDILPAHLQGDRDSRYVAQEEVRQATLDSVWEEVVPPDCAAVFLKIDVQGYERSVLHGARATLGKVVGLQLELSLTPLYADQALYRELLQYLEDLGFNRCAIGTGFVHPATARTLQVDAVFLR